MGHSISYQAGVIAGLMIIIVVWLGLAGFFVFALIKAIKTGRTGWTVGAVASGLPFLAMLLLFFMGAVIGLSRGVVKARLPQEGWHGGAGALLTAAMSPVNGDNLPYTISLPWIDNWGIRDSDSPYDHVFSYKYGTLYIGVIAEAFGGGSPERACDFTQKHMSEKLGNVRFTDPKELTIDHIKWLTYDASGTLSSGADIKYRYYVYADNLRTVQIICWSGPLRFDAYAPVMDRIAGSFQFLR